MITVTSLCHEYRTEQMRTEALSGIDLTIKEGEFVALAGSNGSGKTTLVRHFNAILVPSRGSVYVDGHDTHDSQQVGTVRQLVGMVLSNPHNQIVGTTVEEDIAFGLENLCLPSAEIVTRVQEAMRMVGLRDQQRTNPRCLSDGQKQLVALAGVLAMRPKYIVFDDATSMLDPSMCKVVLGVAKHLHKAYAKSLIWVTHRLDEVMDADRLIILSRGRVVLQGTPIDVLREAGPLMPLGIQEPALVSLGLTLREQGLIGEDVSFSADAIADSLCRLNSRT